MRVLIVVPSQDRITGNWISAGRFQHGLEQLGHQVALQAASQHPTGRLRQRIHDFSPDVALLLHAYRSGKPWLEEASGLEIPSVVLLTGTDVNQGLDDAEQSETIYTVMQLAALVVVQNPLIAAGLTTSRPDLSAKLRLLSPGIILGSLPYDLRGTHGLDREHPLFLCPAGLRPVKGLLKLLTMCDQLTSTDCPIQLVFCGPQLDADYSRRFLAALGERPWASYLGVIAPQAMANAMRGADVILNNSLTEGLANTLLEAATLGVPILACNIPGNAAVVRHNVNGLLYDNEQEFRHYVRELIDPARRRQLACPDPQRYHPGHESAELAAILHDAIKADRCR